MIPISKNESEFEAQIRSHIEFLTQTDNVILVPHFHSKLMKKSTLTGGF